MFQNKKSTISLLSFFKENSEIQFYLGNNFKNWLLSEPCEYVCDVTSSSRLITSEMNNEEIQEKFNPKSYSVSEFLSFLHNNIIKQPKGEGGTLLNDGFWNIFYIDLGNDKIVVVFVYWGVDSERWHCIAVTFDDNTCFKNDCLFSRN